MKKTIISITGIRPDFIRMKNIFKKLDRDFNHILIHSGQHYSKLLSSVFFDELSIRKPDYNLGIGGNNNEHYHQLSNLSVKIIELIKRKHLNPDCILFLGDSNTVTSSIVLKKEGFKIAHIEAGMRSNDKRMLEEINRTVCDHCSDINFVYHKDYKKNLLKENIPISNIYVVGNTIVEIAKEFKNQIYKFPKKYNCILVDIHRPENFKYPIRLRKIIKLSKLYSSKFNLPVHLVKFRRTINELNRKNINIKGIKTVNLMSYKKYLQSQYDALMIISDSGTAQEEACLFKTPVIVPRDFTERPQSMEHNCSYLFNLNKFDYCYRKSLQYIENILKNRKNIDVTWLGNGKTSNKIVEILKKIL